MIFIYNVIFILFIGMLYGKKLQIEKYKKHYLFIVFLQMFLIQGLRSVEVGTDTSFYVNVFDNYLHSEYYSFLFTHYEPGFQGIYILLKQLNLSSQWLLILISAITMICFAIFIYRNSINVVLGTFVFACLIYPNSFNIMRQTLGLSIAINSLYFIINNKYIKAAILILVATLFHATSFLMFIPFILHIVKNWKLARNLILFSGTIFFVLGNKIMEMLLPLVGKSYYLSGFDVTRVFRMTTMITLIIAFISLYFLNNTSKDNIYRKQLNLFSCIAFVNMIFGLLYLKFEFFSRIIEFFNAFLILAVPIWIIVCKRKYWKICRFGFCVVFFCLMLNSVFNSGSGIENYKFFFS